MASVTACYAPQLVGAFRSGGFVYECVLCQQQRQCQLQFGDERERPPAALIPTSARPSRRNPKAAPHWKEAVTFGLLAANEHLAGGGGRFLHGAALDAGRHFMPPAPRGCFGIQWEPCKVHP